MANLTTEAQKRDYLAEEIRKRIVGPGFAQDVYICDSEASDEILAERPQVVYTSGILFPKQDEGDVFEASAELPILDSGNLLGHPYQDAVDINVDDIDIDREDSSQSEDAEQLSVSANSNDMEDGLSDERAGFKPNKFGLITCLNSNTTSVGVNIKYGRYHVLEPSIWKDSVKIPLDNRCPLYVLESTFDYYDIYARDLLTKLGVQSVYDLFSIDKTNLTIAPIREFSYQERDKYNDTKTKYIHPSSFPDLLRNKAANIIITVLNGLKAELIGIDWSELQNQIAIFDSIAEIKELVFQNGWSSLISHVIYDAQENTVRLSGGRFKTGDINIKKYLYTEDPVREYVLDKLLEYRYFKREQVTGHIELDLSTKQFGKEDLGDGVFLHWKAFYHAKNHSIKYLRILLQNCTVVSPRSGEIADIFQPEITLCSKHIVSYSEPQVSFIDEEFNLNEILYSDELVFGKGVNCAVSWENVNEGNPSWIKTTYSPTVKVRSFSTSFTDSTILDVCNVHNLSLWGKSDQEIIHGLQLFAQKYSDWMQNQQLRARSNPELFQVIERQKEFYTRFLDNISFLETDKRAFECFRIANSAMYIQMLLARDARFRQKGKDKSDYPSNDLFFKDCWDYFINAQSAVVPRYYPFQLAFLVINIRSTFIPDDPYRTEKVDLIWFPTGGGKTEAYLALTALTIAERRTSNIINSEGVSVIMRYTLRLLTAQQFERASYLICALEYMRQHFLATPTEGHSLGNKSISLGMWIGQSAAPNKVDELRQDFKYKEFFRNKTVESNPFPIVYCPWCGCNLVGDDGALGYDQGNRGIRAEDKCLNNNCHFHSRLPIYYIDEQLYNNPPTLLFATIDKFAKLNTKAAGKLFGIGSNCRKPDLIIQDELHLISGPIGSLVGLFESFVEELSTERDLSGKIIRTPKIIASTATTRNTGSLIKQLYKRDVISFPASGIRYSDNFFSHVLDDEQSKRKYLGLSTTGHSAAELEIRVIAAELVAKEKLITEWLKNNKIPFTTSDIHSAIAPNGRLIDELDLYWTQVLYYINLKSLGKTHSRISQEIKATVENMKRFSETYPILSFILDGFYSRNTEFTSRQNSSQIKKLLIKADEPTAIAQPQNNMLRVDSMMDIVQATSMISVGIDIDRWNVMNMVGQPLSTAEYIQASSRSGRHHQGLVVNLYNPLRSREHSVFENYTSYHQVFYKFVEPLSATSFTEMTIDKLILNLYVGYMVLIKGKRLLKDVSQVEKDVFYEWLKSRAVSINVPQSFFSSLKSCIDIMYNKLLTQVDSPTHPYSFTDIVSKNADRLSKAGLSHLMKSLRDVEQNTYLNYE